MADNTNSTSPAEMADDTGTTRLAGSLTFTGAIFMGDLPTDDPAVLGQLYSNSGAVTVSTGP